MVRSDLSSQIYGQDLGRGILDPTIEDPAPNTVFARTARTLGIRDYLFFDYPPTLADLMVPLTMFSPPIALLVWRLLNLASVLLTSLLWTKMLGMRLFGQFAFAAVFFLAFRPTLNCFGLGQVPILLLLLLTAGLCLCFQGQKGNAAFMFALATAIRLTPLVVVIPFVVWRDWKVLRAITLWGAAILGALAVFNGPEALSLYFLHILPSMTHRMIDVRNLNLSTAIQVIWYRSSQGTPSIGLLCAGNLASMLVLGYAGWLSRLKRMEPLGDHQRLSVVAIFLLLSCCVAPVSWRHSYVMSAPALLIFGNKVWEGRSTGIEMALLLAFLIEISNDRFSTWAIDSRLPIFGYLAVMTPLLGITLGITELHRFRLERDEGPSVASPTLLRTH